MDPNVGPHCAKVELPRIASRHPEAARVFSGSRPTLQNHRKRSCAATDSKGDISLKSQNAANCTPPTQPAQLSSFGCNPLNLWVDLEGFEPLDLMTASSFSGVENKQNPALNSANSGKIRNPDATQPLQQILCLRPPEGTVVKHDPCFVAPRVRCLAEAPRSPPAQQCPPPGQPVPETWAHA